MRPKLIDKPKGVILMSVMVELPLFEARKRRIQSQPNSKTTTQSAKRGKPKQCVCVLSGESASLATRGRSMAPSLKHIVALMFACALPIMVLGVKLIARRERYIYFKKKMRRHPLIWSTIGSHGEA